MSVEFRCAHEFAVSKARLLALLSDPVAAEARARRLSSAEIEATWEAEARTLEIRQSRRTGFATARFEIVQRTTMESEGRGVWTLEQTGGPGRTRAEGTVSVEPLGDHRSELIVDGVITIDAGALTGLVERLVRGRIRALRKRDAVLMEGQLRV